jgi:CRP-like cAMP-binding protein
MNVNNGSTEFPNELNFGDIEFDTYKFREGQFIFYEDSYPGGIYFIKNGKVKITKIGSDGKEKILRILKPGDFIGYKDLISNTRYSYSAVAFEYTTVYYITKDDFNSLFSKNDVSSYFFRLISNELSHMEQDLVDMAYKPVKRRLIEALLALNEESIKPINISREDLAGYVGSATETVIRLLSDFKKQNLISIKGRMIYVVDTPRLNKIKHLYN